MTAGTDNRTRPAAVHKGRGAVSNPPCRYAHTTIDVEDGDEASRHDQGRPTTVVAPEPARSVISYNRSPDVPFDRSINPYRGCEHGCIYCYARPTHAWLDLSPGLDFETRIFFKEDAAGRLEAELRRPGYVCQPITLGANTDPYQPLERRLQVTRSLLEVLSRCRHPVSIVTKGAGIEGDLDLLADMARQGLASVMVSVTTLDDCLKRSLEPRAAAPARRLQSIEALAAAGVPVGILVAPVIPAINDHEIERILDRCADAGARWAGYVMLRLPLELVELFREWLEAHYPQRAAHVMSIVRQMHHGRAYDARFGRRQTGAGPFAQLIAQRFELAARRRGYSRDRIALVTELFRPPARDRRQLSLL